MQYYFWNKFITTRNKTLAPPSTYLPPLLIYLVVISEDLFKLVHLRPYSPPPDTSTDIWGGRGHWILECFFFLFIHACKYFSHTPLDHHCKSSIRSWSYMVFKLNWPGCISLVFTRSNRQSSHMEWWQGRNRGFEYGSKQIGQSRDLDDIFT